MSHIAKPILIISCIFILISTISGVGRLTPEKYKALLERTTNFVKALLTMLPSKMTEEDCIKSYIDFYVGLYWVADILEEKVQSEYVDNFEAGEIELLAEKIEFLNITCPLRTFDRYDDKCQAAQELATCIKTYLGFNY